MSAEHCPDYVKTLAEDLIEIDVGFTAGDAADQDDAAFQRHGFETRREVWTAVKIEYDVEAAARHVLCKSSETCQSTRFRNYKSRFKPEDFRALVP